MIRSLILLFGILFTPAAIINCYNQEKKVLNLKAEKVSEYKSKLGEGSIWDFQKQILYWIDIDEGILFEYDPVLNTTKSHPAGKKIGTIVPESTNTVILALEDGIYRMNLSNDSLEFLAKPYSLMENQRFNDGKCDPQGRFWVGSMGPEKTCFLYCLDNSGKITEKLDSITISNGIVWSPDSIKMYYVDTWTSKIRQFNFDGNSGSITNEKTIIELPGSLGSPDGMTIDNEGKLWVALWNGSGVYCYDPESGILLQKIDIAAKNITSCAFGNKDLDMLYITTASVGMTREEQDRYPDAGKLFRVKTNARGIKTNYIKLR